MPAVVNPAMVTPSLVKNVPLFFLTQDNSVLTPSTPVIAPFESATNLQNGVSDLQKVVLQAL